MSMFILWIGIAAIVDVGEIVGNTKQK